MDKDFKKDKELSLDGKIVDTAKNKWLEISNPKSILFYFSLVLLNIFTILVVYIYLSAKEGVIQFSIFWENLQFKNILLLLVVFLIINALNVLQLSLRLYSKTKKFKFFSILNTEIKAKFYENCTIYGKGGDISRLALLSTKKISDKNVVILTRGSKNSKDIAKCLYGIIIMILGTFFWLDKSFVVLYIISFWALIILLVITSIRLIFNKNKMLAIKIVAKLSKFLYDIKLIHDFETFYNGVIDNIVIYNKAFKNGKWLIFFEIVGNVFICFLKGLILYFILKIVNISEINVLGEILFKVYIMQVLLDMYPLPRGLFVYELLFIFLFKSVFFEGYVFYGLLLYRIVEYFGYIIQYLIVKVVDSLNQQVCKKDKSKAK